MSITANGPVRVEIISDSDGATRLCDELLSTPDNVVSFDTEAIGYDITRHPVGNGLVFTAQFAWYDAGGVMQVRLLHNYGKSEGLIYDLTRFFQSSDVAKIAHNAPFDFHMVGNHGIVIEGLLLDTMNMDQNLDENRAASLAAYRIPGVGNGHGLKECAKDHLGRERLDYGHTFGNARLRADGLPYASGQLEVPSLNEYLFTELRSSYTSESVTEPPGYEEAQTAEEEERGFWAAWEGTPYENPNLGPYSRWARFYDYACADVVDGLELFYLFRSRMGKIPFSQGKSYWEYYLEVEAPTTRLICDMEKRGMYFDTDTAREMLEVAEQDLVRLETEAVKWCGFPLRTKKKISNLRLAAFLHGDPSNPLPIFRGSSKKKVDFYIHGMGLPVMRSTETGKAGTGAEDLKALRRWAKVTDYRGDLSGLDALIDLSKREWHFGNIQSQVEKTDRWNRIRCRINQVGTTSGRFSTSDPLNLQNVTTGEKDLYHDRDCFAAPPGKVLIVMDFSQLEYRLLAHFSQEPKLIALFHEGWDLHSLTCYNIFPEVRSATDHRYGGFTLEAGLWIAEEYPNERKKAKTLNFEIIYGVGFRKLAEQLNIAEEEGKAMVDGWFSGYPNVRLWQERELSEASRRGYGRNLTGRFRRPILRRLNHDCKAGCPYRKDPNRRCGIRGEEERTFLNALIQGSAAGVCKKAMLALDRDEELKAAGYQITMQVHDEIVGEFPIGRHKWATARVKTVAESIFGSRPLRVPLPVSVGYGPSWASAKV